VFKKPYGAAPLRKPESGADADARQTVPSLPSSNGGSMSKRVAIYSHVSTERQTVANQVTELRA
jgi:hypothetical protein